MLFAIVAAVVALLVIVPLWWHFERASSLLHEWAAKNDYRILHQEYRHICRGPFSWTSTGSQAVYYVVIEDGEGSTGSGWVRCGSFWFGLLSDKVEVRWDA